jgi:hypothetical protein
MGLKSGTNLDGVAMATINESLCGEGNSENDDSHHNKVDMSDYEKFIHGSNFYGFKCIKICLSSIFTTSVGV